MQHMARTLSNTKHRGRWLFRNRAYPCVQTKWLRLVQCRRQCLGMVRGLFLCRLPSGDICKQPDLQYDIRQSIGTRWFVSLPPIILQPVQGGRSNWQHPEHLIQQHRLQSCSKVAAWSNYEHETECCVLGRRYTWFDQPWKTLGSVVTTYTIAKRLLAPILSTGLWRPAPFASVSHRSVYIETNTLRAKPQARVT